MLLISLPHSGTNFLRNFIGTAPGSDGIRGISHLRDAPPAEGNHLYWGHFDPFEWHWIEPYARKWRMVVPVRDPLAVAISHHTRGSHMDIANWARATVAFDAHVAHYVPLDLMRMEHDRIDGLRNALRAVGIERGDSGHHWTRWAKEWETISRDPLKAHASGDNEMKGAYLSGDIDYLSKEIPDMVFELRKHERSLRPWLERIGYESLMWWS